MVVDNLQIILGHSKTASPRWGELTRIRVGMLKPVPQDRIGAEVLLNELNSLRPKEVAAVKYFCKYCEQMMEEQYADDLSDMAPYAKHQRSRSGQR